MNVLILSGSRDSMGQTAQAAAALAEGISAAGGKSQTVFLPEKTIERCRQCDQRGWGICMTKDRCIIDDDFAGLVDQLRSADAAVFATPVYFGDLSESLQAFLNRLRRISWNVKDRVVGVAGMPAVGLCVAGGGGGGSYRCAAVLEHVLNTAGFAVADIVPIRRQNLQTKLPALKELGRSLGEIVRNECDER